MSGRAPGAGPGRLEGTVALVTGGGSGLGAALALRFAAEGAAVSVVDRDADRAKDVAGRVEAAGGRSLGLAADVRSSGELHAAVDATVSAFGRLDTVLPNAGIWDYQRTLARMDGARIDAAFDEIFGVNVKGYLLTVEAAYRELVRTEGSVVMTLSNASLHPNGGGPLYTASKHACLGLVRELAYELAPKVRVNGVACGGMRTGLAGPVALGLDGRSLADSFARNERAAGDERRPIPLWRSSVEPEAFTGPFVMLASARDAGTITGAVVPADGGIAVRGFRTPAGGDDL